MKILFGRKLRNTKIFLLLISLFLLSQVFILDKVEAATYAFEPASGNLIEGCTYNLNIMIDATGENSNAADLEVSYNPSEIEIKDSLSDIPGIQVKPGNAYEVYFYNKVDSGVGKIQLAGGSFLGTLTSKKIYGIVQFSTKPGVTSTSFDIYFNGVGATLDSNIADTVTSLDLLTGVTNGSYTFSPGSCIKDTQSPPVNFLDPRNGLVDVALDSTIEIRITDNMSGVDLDSVIFIINGVEYTIDSSRVTYSGDPLNYLFKIDPIDDFPENESSIIRVIVSDLAGNKSNAAIVFNLPEDICECPECEDCIIGEEVSCPTGFDDCSEEFLDFLDDPSLFDGTFLENSWIADLLERLGIVGSVASIAGLPLFLSLLFSLFPYLSLLYAPGFLQDIWALITGKKRKPWGIVTNAEDDKPIPFAIVTASLVESNALVKRVITDTEGRYNLEIDPGSYLIEVRKTNFEKAQSSLVITEDSPKYAKDFELYPIGAQVSKEEIESKGKKSSIWWQKTKNRLKVWWKYIKVVLFCVGFASAIIAVIISPNLFNWIVFVFYIIVIIVLILIKYRYRNPTSLIVNYEDRLKMPFVKIKFYNLETNEVEDAQISNEKGAFDFWGKPGTYGVWLYKHGFNYPITEQRNYEVVEIEGQKVLKIDLKKGKNQLRLLMKRIDYFRGRPENSPSPPIKS